MTPKQKMARMLRETGHKSKTFQLSVTFGEETIKQLEKALPLSPVVESIEDLLENLLIQIVMQMFISAMVEMQRQKLEEKIEEKLNEYMEHSEQVH
jgi:hypothetical protein